MVFFVIIIEIYIQGDMMQAKFMVLIEKEVAELSRKEKEKNV